MLSALREQTLVSQATLFAVRVWLAALSGGFMEAFCVLGKLVVTFMKLTSWSKLVGRMRQLERQTMMKVSGSVLFVAQEHQAAAVS